MPLLYCLTLVLSAGLMFVVEPMFAKMVLPLLGGSPSVWNTCLVFYQAALMAGYIYAHVSLKYLGPRRQSILHLGLLCLPWLVLPIAVSPQWAPQGGDNPIPWLFKLLAVAVGLPFLCLAASAPVLSAWFAVSGQRSARDPYFLYAASNLGSLVGLAAYPLGIEPHWNLAAQSRGWTVGYAVMTVLFAMCAASLWFARSAKPASDFAEDIAEDRHAITIRRRLMWLALSIVPSSLLMGVTTHLSTDVAAFPLLWVIPLGLYLLSFVMVFARWKLLDWLAPIRLVQAVLLVATAALFYSVGIQTGAMLGKSLLHLATFFVTALVCHGALAADRPSSRHLTEYYLWMSAGGVIGGLLCALIAPLIFKSVAEYPLMLVAACLLRPSFSLGAYESMARKLDVPVMLALAAIYAFSALGLQGDHLIHLISNLKLTAATGFAAWISSLQGKILLAAIAATLALLLQRRRETFAVAIGTLLVLSSIYSYKSNTLYSVRSFFGVLRVVESTYHAHDTELHCHRLMHGSTMHGAQSLDADDAREPWAYYHRTGPVGDAIAALEDRPEFVKQGTIGVVGLGAGSIAAYARPGQRLRYFEIDPAVCKIAEDPDYFTYLSNCRADWNICLGDARLTLAAVPDGQFDVLFIDAFSSDAIPVHLITREAVTMYLRKLAPHGLLMVHLSNRHLRLQPVLAASAEALSLVSRQRLDDDESSPGKSSSLWGVLARREADLGRLGKDARWTPLETDRSIPPWTDDYSSITSALSGDWLPWRTK